MKVCVTGGRPKNLPRWCDREYVFGRLSEFRREIFPVSELIEGEAEGVDRWSAEWARTNAIRVTPIPITRSMWKDYGQMAGPIRNGIMLDQNPEYLIAFPGGPGTRDMINQARLRKIAIKYYNTLPTE